MTNCLQEHVSLGSKSKLWSPHLATARTNVFFQSHSQRTQTAGFSVILIALWTMKKTIPKSKYTHSRNHFFSIEKYSHSRTFYLNVANWYRVLTNTNKVCKISWPGCWFSYPRANLDGTAWAKSCPSIGPSFIRPSIRSSHWTEHVAVGTDVMEPNPNHTSTNPRILSVSLRRLWLLGRPRHDAPLCWDLRDKSFDFF